MNRVTIPTWLAEEQMSETTVNVRYMVEDVETSIAWYASHLGFEVMSNHAPAFADVRRSALRLLLSGPASSAGRPMSDGEQPRPLVGTASTSWSTILLLRWPKCVRPACSSATKLSKGPVARKF